MISYQSLYTLGKAPGEDVLGDIQRFRRVSRDGFNVTDSVDVRYFKLLFYFYNDPIDSTQIDWFTGGGSGLLSPTWIDYPESTDYYKFNSAWSFLKNNYEEERADALKTFVELLSNISTESPWYFQKVSGVDEALTRTGWKIGDERKKITIECLSDPIDHRIESLLSLYRSIVWSHARKCEILPSNLRKFDMGLFVFSGLTDFIHHSFKKIEGEDNNSTKIEQWASFGNLSSLGALDNNNTAYKYIEFHNCEINMDSIKSGYGDLSNSENNEQTFSIEIYFDDCYENEYNPFLLKSFGDFFLWDMWESSRNDNGESSYDIQTFQNTLDKTNSESSSYRSANKYMQELLGRRTDKPPRQIDTNKSIVGKNIFKDDYSAKRRTISNNPLMRMGDSVKYAVADAQNQAKGLISGAVGSIKNSAVNALTGGLGNIYGDGFGAIGAINGITGELGQQMKSLQSKITGNINGSLTDISRSLTNAATAPAKGAIKTTGTFMSDVVQSATNIVAKPVAGTAKMVENIAKRTTDTVSSYVNEAGEYLVNKTNDLGQIAYDTQANLPNAIGKNRLNAKLGNINK